MNFLRITRTFQTVTGLKEFSNDIQPVFISNVPQISSVALNKSLKGWKPPSPPGKNERLALALSGASTDDIS